MIISQTPLRISLLGGGTDFYDFYSIHGGSILSLAIDKYIYVIVKKRFDKSIYINYSQKEIVNDLNEIKHDLVRESMRIVGINGGIEITTLSDIPSEGSGLGSSSSVTVGLLNALYTYKGELVTQEKLFRDACEIEINVLGKPIGIQDQLIATYGNLRFFKINTDGLVDELKINIDEELKRKLVSNLLLFYTNKTRSADKILSEQKFNISLNYTHLRKIKELSERAYYKIHKEEFSKIGTYLNQNWKEKKKLAKEITNSRIDKMYQTAIDNGAIGGKIAGAGGGGFLLLYCSREKQDKVRNGFREYRELPFMLSKYGTRIIFNIEN